jgi:hypothetical protein
MTLKQVGLFFWYLFSPKKTTEQVREAEIDTFGGGSGPKT